MPLVVLAVLFATLVAALALRLGATGRGVGLLLLVAALLMTPRVNPRAAAWFRGYRRSLLALALLALALLGLFQPTRLFIFDVMEAVQP